MTKLRDRRISQRTVDALSVEERDAVFWDCDLPGFGVWVYPNGTNVYVVQIRGHGKSKRVTIGRHGLFTADQARRMAVRIIINIMDGEHPGRSPTDKAKVTARVADADREWIHTSTVTRNLREFLAISISLHFMVKVYIHRKAGIDTISKQLVTL